MQFFTTCVTVWNTGIGIGTWPYGRLRACGSHRHCCAGRLAAGAEAAQGRRLWGAASAGRLPWGAAGRHHGSRALGRARPLPRGRGHRPQAQGCAGGRLRAAVGPPALARGPRRILASIVGRASTTAACTTSSGRRRHGSVSLQTATAVPPSTPVDVETEVAQAQHTPSPARRVGGGHPSAGQGTQAPPQIRRVQPPGHCRFQPWPWAWLRLPCCLGPASARPHTRSRNCR